MNEINSNAFASSALESFSFPSCTKLIGSNAFLNCVGLDAVEFLSFFVSVKVDYFYDSNSIVIVACPNAKKVEIDRNTLSNFADGFILLVDSGSHVI